MTMSPNRIVVPLLPIFMCLSAVSAHAQWHAAMPELKGASWMDGNALRAQERETVQGARAVAYDHVALSEFLAEAPAEYDPTLREGQSLGSSTCRITLPLPSEGLPGWESHAFRVVRSDVMAPE